MNNNAFSSRGGLSTSPLMWSIECVVEHRVVVSRHHHRNILLANLLGKQRAQTCSTIDGVRMANIKPTQLPSNLENPPQACAGR